MDWQERARQQPKLLPEGQQFLKARKWTPKDVADMLRACHGERHITARRLKISVATVNRYIKEFDICEQAEAEARGYIGDLAEWKLIEAIAEGKPWAIQFYLKAQCKDRGYGDEASLGPWLRERALELAEARGLDKADALAQAERILAEGRLGER